MAFGNKWQQTKDNITLRIYFNNILYGFKVSKRLIQHNKTQGGNTLGAKTVSAE